MRVPHSTTPRTQPSSQGLSYLDVSVPDFSGLTRGLNTLAAGVRSWEEKNRVEQEQSKRFQALGTYSDFKIKVDETLQAAKESSPADTANFDETWQGMYENLEKDFIESLPEDQREEFRYHAQTDRRRTYDSAREFGALQRREYSKARIDAEQERAEIEVDKVPQTLQERERLMHDFIDRAPGLSQTEKEDRKRAASKSLRGIKYKWEIMNGGGARRTDRETRDDRAPRALSHRAQVIEDKAKQLGIEPFELALVMSYETGGRFSPSVRGGAGNRHIGLIQFGESEQREFGANQNQSFDEQMEAVVRYLKARGLKPGMRLRDIYSTINAGRPGRYSASDRPGENIDTHVARMSNENDYRYKAAKDLMGGAIDLDAIDSDPQYDGVPLEDRLAIRRDAEQARSKLEAEALKARTEAEEAARNELFIGLAKGTKGQREFDEYEQAGLLEKYEDWNKARKILEDRENETHYAREGAEKIGAMGRGGNAYFDPSDAEDNKRLNAVIGPDGLAKIAASDDDYFTNYIVPTVRTTHVVPENVAGALNAMVRSRDPKKALWALDAWSRIQDQDPKAFAQRADDKIARDVDFWRAKRQYYSEEELLKQINGGNTQEERQAKAILREEAEKIVKEGKEVSATEYLDHWDSYFASEPSLSNVPWAMIEMGRDYNSVFIEEFVRYGNVKEAATATARAMDRLWGVTEVGGIKTLMKYPPDKVGYNPAGPYGDMSWIDRQVRNEFSLPEDSQFQLLSDKRTEQEYFSWQAGKGANPPSYQVVVRGPYGDWRVARAPDGKDARIYFQVTPEERAGEERAFAVKKTYKDLNEFMADTFHPAQTLWPQLPDETKQELMKEKERLEGLYRAASEQAGVSVQTPMLPHPLLRRRFPNEEDIMKPLPIKGLE